MNSWVLQYLLGIKDLGHDVYFVEKYGYANSCYDPMKDTMSSDCSYGLKIVSELLERYGLKDKWCYVAEGEVYHGITKNKITEVFTSADLFIDMGCHGSWAEEAGRIPLQVLIDGEPGYTHINMANKVAAGIPLPKYDRYFTNGKNIGLPGNPAPTLSINWEHIYSPVKTELFTPFPAKTNAPYSTVMNWRSHAAVRYNGKTYGQKDIEFKKFLPLPKLIKQPMEVAVSGKEVPVDLLKENNWLINDAKTLTLSFDSFRNYILYCRGEFSVCKNVFVENNTGWFSDKSAAYLASGRPVVLQNTGFGSHLPVGEGLFAVSTVQEAKDAIENIEANYRLHCNRAREIAFEYLEAKTVMKFFLNELGL